MPRANPGELWNSEKNSKSREQVPLTKRQRRYIPISGAIERFCDGCNAKAQRAGERAMTKMPKAENPQVSLRVFMVGATGIEPVTPAV